MLTISNIPAVSYPVVLKMLLDGNDWMHPELRKAAKDGRLPVESLGPCMIDARTGKHHTPEEILIPLTWAKSDEEQSEAEQIRMVKGLIENGLRVHDDLLLEKLGTGYGYMSKEYRYCLTGVQPVAGGEGLQVRLYTAGVFIQ